MEVVKPELYWVQDRCYRRNPSRNNHRLMDENPSDFKKETVSKDIDENGVQGPYMEHDEYSCDPDAPDEDEDNSKYMVEKIESGFKARADMIPSSFYPFIIGAKGATKKRIESETNTKIIIPRINEKGSVVIRGSKRKEVLHALRRLELMCSQARAKRDLTHFACFPMNDPSVIVKFHEFQKALLEEFGGMPGSGLEEKIFQDPEKLHLTLAVMTLLDSRERDEVSKLLQSLESDVRNLAGNKKHVVKLCGLEIMNDDPSDVHVLYAKCILEDDVLQSIANLVANQLATTGYTREARGENIKLHATLINTRFRAESSEDSQGPNHRGSRGKRESFDARKILEKYGEFEFGIVEVKEIAVVTRFTKDKSGFYNTMTRLRLGN